MSSTRHAKTTFCWIVLTAAAMTLSGCGSDNSTGPVHANPSSDPASPTPPSELSVVKATQDGLKLGWQASPDLDVIGYEIYLYDPHPSRDNSYVKLNPVPCERTSFGFSDLEVDVAYYFKVKAVNSTGLKSQACSPLEVLWNGGPYEASDEVDGTDPPPRDPPGDRSGGDPEPGHPREGEDDDRGRDR
ncbi:MAG: hypothetical protein GF355_01585 [Candidatus Eisenbacteria bacterium]|nr:hypothetical protein [Candidatus Eisenbacteria bacterium]